MKQPTKYDIAKEFTAGFCSGMRPSKRFDHENEHWLAGYDAGYKQRTVKKDLLNQYLISIGQEPMGVVVLCATDKGPT